MRAGIKLGRLAGVPVTVGWSLTIAAALYTWLLAVGRYPFDHPGYPEVAYWVAAAVTAVAFFASVLVHELAHAAVARRENVGVDGIKLWLLGGMAQLRGEPPTPGAELRIAAAGPLSSLALGVAFALLALATNAVGYEGLVGAVPTWLAVINVVLGLFNILPAAPLDGGRVLAAAMWWKRGDRTAATINAARAGRGLGWILIGLGSAQSVVLGSPAGLWTAMVGLFVATSASDEERAAIVRGALRDRTVGDIMTAEPPIVDDWMTVEAAVNQAIGWPPQSAPVRGFDGSIRGLVTPGKITALTEHQRAVTRIPEIALPAERLSFARPDEPALEALGRSLRAGSATIIVVDDQGMVRGIVGARELRAATGRTRGARFEQSSEGIPLGD